MPEQPVIREIATILHGRDITRGYVDELPFLQPTDTVLASRGGQYQVYEALARDDQVMAAFSQRRLAVVSRPTQVVPGGSKRRDKAAAAFMQEVLNHIRWDTVTDRMLYGRLYGYSVAECLWARDGAQVMLDRLAVRQRRRFVFAPDMSLRLLTAQNPEGEALPDRKFWTLVTGADNDDEPYGLGLGHHLYWPVFFKRHQVQFWLAFGERFGKPTVVGNRPPNASEAAKAALIRAVEAISQGRGAVLEEGEAVQFLQSARPGAVDYGGLYDRLNGAITKIILGQTMTVDDGSSLSQANVHLAVRDDIVTSDAHLICDSFNRSVVRWLSDWNFPSAAHPKVVRDMTAPPDLKALAERDAIVASMTGKRPTDGYVRETYGLELIDDTAQTRTPPPPGGAAGKKPTTQLAEADDQDVVSRIAARARREMGPLIDQWIEDLRRQVGLDDSLVEVRARLDTLLAWTADPHRPTPDVAPAVATLRPALVAAHLAGRHDVKDANAVQLAESPAFAHARLPFTEQIDFFRAKLNIPTQAWTDLWHEQHDKGFMVAGAAHADLLYDLRGAVDSAIAEGTTLEAFRKRFDGIVAKHGWSYKGGRDWRTRVIYDTNIRASYAAGRRQQLQDSAESRPYWRYRHSRASTEPRDAHSAWDGLILRHDDPWWTTHYPPNGWGCKCYVEALSERDLKRLGKSGPDQAPPVKTRTVTVGAKGPSPRNVTVPEGIDPGWAYAPGQSTLRKTSDPWAIDEITQADATLRRVGPQQGSNPGGTFQGADGKLRYVKFYQDPAQAYGEAVANRAYRELGIDAPASALVRNGQSIVGVANDVIDHSGTLGTGRLAKGRSQQVLKGYATDVWLANWDAVGLNHDNIIRTRKGRNSVARIDQGGALLTRARQGRKPAARLEDITEWDGFADPAVNPAYAKVLRTAGLASADELGRQAIRQIQAIQTLGKRTNNFQNLAPDVRGIPATDRRAIQNLLAKRAQLLQTQILPRIRAAIAASKSLPSYAIQHKKAMGAWYNDALANGKKKVKAGFNPHGMSDPELASGYSYTTSHQQWSYLRLNRTLRDAEGIGGRKLPEKYRNYALTLNDALDRLPDYPAERLRRGATLTPEEIAKHIPGEIITKHAFTSASMGQGFGGNARFIITSLHGKRIDGLSAHPSELEVLFKAGTRFRVLSNERKGSITEIRLKEVDDG